MDQIDDDDPTMADSQFTTNDETDLLELAEIIWKERLLLILVVTVSTLIGGVFVAIDNPTYEARIEFEVELIPPFKNAEEVEFDISKAFNNSEIFSRWKKDTTDSGLEFADVLETNLIDNFPFAVSESSRLIAIKNDHVVIKSNDVEMIVAILDYLEFKGSELAGQYVLEGADERARLQGLLNTLNPKFAPADMLAKLDSISTLDRFLKKASERQQLLHVFRPSRPVKTSLAARTALIISVIAGGVCGVVFILVRDAVRKRNLKQIKSTG